MRTSTVVMASSTSIAGAEDEAPAGLCTVAAEQPPSASAAAATNDRTTRRLFTELPR